MATKSVTIKDEQTIFDLSLQMYGSIESVYKIIQDNPSIIDIHTEPLQGMSIVYEEQTLNLTKYFSTNNKSISTNYPKISGLRSFDDSFNISFR
jgi:hypothetical protein